ncbi:MAG: helix-turn-helix transcriptional regulator [Jatrophihabitantaceae bacterium]
MFVPLATLDRAVRLVDDLADLTDPDDFTRVALPALADLIGCDVMTYNEVSASPGDVVYADWPRHALAPAVTLAVDGPTLVGIAFDRAATEFDDTDRAVLSVLRRPLLRALQRTRTRTPVRQGETALTRAERAVLDLVADGLTNQAIARRFGVSPRTVAKHLEHVYRKLGVANRAGAVARARRSPS